MRAVTLEGVKARELRRIGLGYHETVILEEQIRSPVYEGARPTVHKPDVEGFSRLNANP